MLSSVIIPSGVTTIGSNAFKSCRNMKKVFIPSSVTQIKNDAFAECSNLTNVTVGFSKPFSITANTFSNRWEATLHVPLGCGLAFKSADIWRDFLSISEAEDCEVSASMIAETTELLRGGMGDLTISLENDAVESYATFQTDIFLPEGITPMKNGEDFITMLSSRFSGDGVEVSVEEKAAGVYRLACNAPDGVTITGTEGPLVSLRLKASPKLSPGDYDSELRDVTIRCADGAAVKSADVNFSIKVSTYLLGDVNLDGFVNVSDIMIVVNYILGNEVNSTVELMDINQDSRVTVTDVMQIVNIILQIEN